jgi:hypothetical protein
MSSMRELVREILTPAPLHGIEGGRKQHFRVVWIAV